MSHMGEIIANQAKNKIKSQITAINPSDKSYYRTHEETRGWLRAPASSPSPLEPFASLCNPERFE